MLVKGRCCRNLSFARARLWNYRAKAWFSLRLVLQLQGEARKLETVHEQNVDVERCRCGSGLREAIDRIVIGDGDGRQTLFRRQHHELCRGQRAVGRSGMSVKVDRLH